MNQSDNNRSDRQFMTPSSPIQEARNERGVRPNSREERVRSVFNVAEKYLQRRQFDIRVRAEVVEHFTKETTYQHVLDIGCGDGSLSIPLLPRCAEITLVDLSRQMLKLAWEKVPADRAHHVHLVEGNLMGVELPLRSFDLIICVGVLAHVQDPSLLIARLAHLARPGSQIILEFTDSSHFWSMPVLLYQHLLGILRRPPYPLNRLNERNVRRWCAESKLEIAAMFRYGIPWPGLSTLMGQDTKYQFVRRFFGHAENNKRNWLGNEFLMSLKVPSTPLGDLSQMDNRSSD